MSNFMRHPYHLVEESPWPLRRSLGALILTVGLVQWFRGGGLWIIANGLLVICLRMVQWWRDVRNEGTFLGLHSSVVELGLRGGIILFIVSEVFFFLSFFWAFFHRSLAPAVELGGVWPPLGILPLNPFQVPLLASVVLISSGVRVTWAHHRIIENNHFQAKVGLLVTVVLGLYFTCLQAIEYYEASFSLSDSVYGRTFYIATGFHGLHVIVGTLFLMAGLFRLNAGHFRNSHHFGFEAAAWYWHFVDVVWLFLYVAVYWWGGAR